MNKLTFKLALGAAVLIPAIAAVTITIASDGSNLPARKDHATYMPQEAHHA